MMPWYQSNGKLFRYERGTLVSAAPLMGMFIADPNYRLNSEVVLAQEAAVVQGTFGIGLPDTSEEIEYRICILMPYRYPTQLPLLFCNDPKLPIGNIDRHIMNDGSACLGVYADIMTRWSMKPNIVNFLDNFVAPFLVWQAYYDVHHQPPPWGQRPHFADGIIEFYSELIGIHERQSVIEFMKLLARKNRPKGHERCPCGSGERLRNCHRQLLYSTREKIAWEYVVKDLQAILSDNQAKSGSENRIVQNIV